MSGVYFVSLGCPKNLVDTEVLAGLLLTSGRELTFEPNSADIYLINTCAFIPSARSEAVEAIEKAVKWKRRAPKKFRKIIVAGCLPQYDKEAKCPAQFPEVDLWMGVDEIPKLENLLKSLDAAAGKKSASDHPAYLYDHTTPRLQLTVPHMAYLKIADGCNNCCSYCAIPGIRGKLRSRSIASVKQEAANLLKNGVKELVLIAQDVTVFGQDRPQDRENLAGLLRELDQLAGDFRIRLLYTHPAHYNDELIAVLAESKHVLPYLDIPLQHVSERILKAMNRHVTRAEIDALLEKLRAKIPGLVLRTTFISGFPGETEAEFGELAEFLKKWRFERCGVFAFSPEPGTPAAKMADQIDLSVANARAEQLMAIQEKIMAEYQASQVGKTIEVLADVVDGSVAAGRGAADAPEIDNSVLFRGRRLKAGNFYQVTVESVNDMDLIGIIGKE